MNKFLKIDSINNLHAKLLDIVPSFLWLIGYIIISLHRLINLFKNPDFQEVGFIQFSCRMCFKCSERFIMTGVLEETI